MTIEEFNCKLPDDACQISEIEFDIVQFVYNYHPIFEMREDPKQQAADLWYKYGITIFIDMLDTAIRVSEIYHEKRELEHKIDELDEECKELMNPTVYGRINNATERITKL